MRPIDPFSNPEYAFVLLSATELRLYVGDNTQLELLESREVTASAAAQPRLFSPGAAVIAHRPLIELKRFAIHLLQIPRLARLPVVVSGEALLVAAFMRLFDHPFGVVRFDSQGIEAKTCPEILRLGLEFRPAVQNIYLQHFRERLRLSMRTGRVVSAESEIAKAIADGVVSRLLLASHPAPHSHFDQLARAVLAQHGKVQLVPVHLFPAGIQMLATLRGDLHAHSPILAMDA
jgi:hypothetical protein